MPAVKEFFAFAGEKPLASLGVGIAAFAIGLGIAAANRTDAAKLIAVERGTLVEAVIVTGKVTPTESVDLAFERAGKIVLVRAAVGDEVTRGQILAELDRADLSAELAKAESMAGSAKAKLMELERGAREEEIDVAKAKAESVAVSLIEAKRNLVDKIFDAYAKADDAIRGKVDRFISSPRTANPQINFQVADFGLKNAIEFQRIITEQALVRFADLVAELTPETFRAPVVDSVEEYLKAARIFLGAVAAVVNALTPNPALSPSMIDSYQNDVSTGRTNVHAAISNLSAAREKLKAAEASLRIAEAELNLARSPATAEALAMQKAAVKEAEAELQRVRAQIAKTIIRAPLSGTVAKNDARVGEIVAASTPLITLIARSSLEIEANVPEVDIDKVAIGKPVEIAFDAFPGKLFHGRVTYVDPAETVIDGVVSYKINIVPENAGVEVRSGLTANLEIETVRKENALLLPQFAIIETDLGAFVEKKERSILQRTPIEVGIRGDEGLVEIVSGLKEGDWVANIGLKLSPQE